jgi:SapC
MARFVIISRENHGSKTWSRPQNYGFAGADALAPVVGAELGAAALSIPLGFLEQGGRFSIVAVLSLVPGQNMFVAPDGRWLGSYVPACFRTYPFRMLPQQGTDKLVLCTDEESGLIHDEGSVGEKFFDEEGGISPALKPIFDLLMEVERSRWATGLAVAALAEAGVIRHWDIKVKSEQGQQAISGLHRIDEGALRSLPNDLFLKLRAASALPVAYTQLLSGGQIRIFGHLAKLRQQLAPPPMPSIPESLGSLFEMPGDTLRFD